MIEGACVDALLLGSHRGLTLGHFVYSHRATECLSSNQGEATRIPLTPRRYAAEARGGKKKPKESGGADIASASEQTDTRCCWLLCLAPAFASMALCFPLALQRGFASVAGRGVSRSDGVRVTQYVFL